MVLRKRSRRAENDARCPMRLLACALVLSVVAAAGWSRTIEDPPTEWIEPATGHHVIRLSREPGSASLYFHQNQYTADGATINGIVARGALGRAPADGALHGRHQEGRDQRLPHEHRLAESRPVLAHRSDARHVLPRGSLAQSGPHLDHPHGWKRPPEG